MLTRTKWTASNANEIANALILHFFAQKFQCFFAPLFVAKIGFVNHFGGEYESKLGSVHTRTVGMFFPICRNLMF